MPEIRAIDKKQLEILLSKLHTFQKANPTLEQYTIPSNLAAEIVNFAHLNGDIEEKFVCDFGCGTGRLAIGAALMGARKVVAVDIDKSALKDAHENLSMVKTLTEIEDFPEVEFICADIKDFQIKCDTVIQNPPFGIQQPHRDRIFLQKAIECADRVYSLHKDGYPKTVTFLTEFIENNGARVEHVKKFIFDLPYTFKFHKKPKYSYNVDLYVIDAGSEKLNEETDEKN